MGNFINRTINVKFTELLKNQVDWILPVVFNWQHLYANWWFLWDIFSLTKSLPENHNSDRSKDLSFKFFQLKRTFCLCFRHLNLTMTRFRFFKWWHESSCSGVTLAPVRDKALKSFSSKISSSRLSGTEFISIVSFCNIENLSPHSFPAELFFVTDDYNSFLISAILSRFCHVKSLNFSVSFESFVNTSDNLSYSSTNSFLLMFYVWLLVKTMIIYLKLEE